MSSYICKKCGKKTKYSEEYDTYYCLDCNIWNESQCSDPDCYYCRNTEKGSPKELLKTVKHFDLSLGFLGDREAVQNFERLIEDESFRDILKTIGVKQLTGWFFDEIKDEEADNQASEIDLLNNEIEQLKKQLQQREVDLMETELEYKAEIKQLEAANKRIYKYYENKFK